jgi:Skp family chaperone for outer membrane proteins
VAIAAGLVALGALIYCGGQLLAQAQAPQPQPRPLQSRIGLINMVQVLKNYKKFQSMELDLKTRAQQLDEQLKPLKMKAEGLKAEYGNPKTTQERKEEIEREMRKLQSEGSDAETAAQKEMAKRNGEAAVTIYKEIQDSAQAYARANNLELVFFYNDAITESDFYHPANVRQKMMTPAAVMPMVVAPGMDISDALVNYLNQKYTSAAPVGANTPAAPHR